MWWMVCRSRSIAIVWLSCWWCIELRRDLAMVEALTFPKILSRFRRNTSTTPEIKLSPLPLLTLAEKKQELLKAISFTNNGKDATTQQQAKVLQLVRALETKFPVPDGLLSNPIQSKILDGIWYLQYTSPSRVVGDDVDRVVVDDIDAWQPQYANEGLSNIETEPFQARGTVTAAGITIDTSQRVVRQMINVAEQIVTNDVQLDWGQVVVSGRFRPSPVVPNRVVVAFDRADVSVRDGPPIGFGWFFTVSAWIRGSADNGWLEVTYVDDDIRISRGNRGTMFVLTRDLTAVKP